MLSEQGAEVGDGDDGAYDESTNQLLASDGDSDGEAESGLEMRVDKYLAEQRRGNSTWAVETLPDQSWDHENHMKATTSIRMDEAGTSKIQLELPEMQWETDKLRDMQISARVEHVMDEATSNEMNRQEEYWPTHDGMQELATGYRGTTLARSSTYYGRVTLYVGALLVLDWGFVACTTQVDPHMGLGRAFPSSCVAAVLLHFAMRLCSYRWPGMVHALVAVAGPGMEFIAAWRPLFYLATLPRLYSAAPIAPAQLLSLGGCRVVALLAAALSAGLAHCLVCLAQAQYARFAQGRWSSTEPSRGAFGQPQDAGGRGWSMKAAYGPWEPSEERAWWRLAGMWIFIGVLSFLPAVVFSQSATRLDVPWVLPCVFQFSFTIALYTLAAFVVPFWFRSVFPPGLVFAGGGSLLLLAWAWGTNSTVAEAVQAYHRETVIKPGAGDLLSLLLGASMLSLAVEIFPARSSLDRALPRLVLASLAQASMATFLCAAAASAFQLPQEYAYAAALQSLPPPLAVALAEHVGLNPGLVVAILLVPGLGGARLVIELISWVRRSWNAPAFLHESSAAASSTTWEAVLLGILCAEDATVQLARNGEMHMSAVASAAWLLSGTFTTCLIAPSAGRCAPSYPNSRRHPSTNA